ncbi:hypothetical protein [Microcoleus sp. CAWBG58]|nr:hypothetical protein [Microcoleus sp. CAWBG58]
MTNERCLTLEMVRKLDRELYLQKIGRINRDAGSHKVEKRSPDSAIL